MCVSVCVCVHVCVYVCVCMCVYVCVRVSLHCKAALSVYVAVAVRAGGRADCVWRCGHVVKRLTFDPSHSSGSPSPTTCSPSVCYIRECGDPESIGVKDPY